MQPPACRMEKEKSLPRHKSNQLLPQITSLITISSSPSLLKLIQLATNLYPLSQCHSSARKPFISSAVIHHAQSQRFHASYKLRRRLTMRSNQALHSTHTSSFDSLMPGPPPWPPWSCPLSVALPTATATATVTATLSPSTPLAL